MSELYLVLRERLRSVAEEDWVEIDGDVLLKARKRRGIGRETLGALIHVSSKTIERWEKTGRVKRASVPALARELDLQIEEPAFEPLTVKVAPLADDERGAVLRELASIRAALEAGRDQDRRLVRLEKKVDRLLAQQAPPRRTSRRAGSPKPN